jgi:hypothetical protein
MNKERELHGRIFPTSDPKGRRNERSYKRKWGGFPNNKPKIKGEDVPTT